MKGEDVEGNKEGRVKRQRIVRLREELREGKQQTIKRMKEK